MNRLDEHFRAMDRVDRLTRERVRGLRELSPEATAYEVTKAIREGRMSQFRDELDYRDNVHLWHAAKLTLAGAAVLFAVAFAALVWVVR